MVNAAGDYVVSFIVSRYVDGKDWLQKALGKKKRKRSHRAVTRSGICQCIKFLPPGNTTLYRMGGIFMLEKSRSAA